MKENKDLKVRASTLETENTDLKSRLGLTPPSSPTSSEDTTPSPLPSPPHSPCLDEPTGIVVKQEKESSEYAELNVSQQKEHSPIPFLSLLTTTVLLHLLRQCIPNCLGSQSSNGVQSRLACAAQAYPCFTYPCFVGTRCVRRNDFRSCIDY